MNWLKHHLHIVILSAVILVGAVIRFYNLDSSPRGVLVDEPAFGYSAYSILETGRDEWGKSFPIVFKSYGDQKMPLYVYSLVFLILIYPIICGRFRFDQ